MMKHLINQSNNQILARNVILAKNVLSRMKGLIGRKDMDLSEALWILPCWSLHTCFMKFALDVVFVDCELQVSYVRQNVTPWHWVHPPFSSKSHSVFEMKTPVLSAFKIQLGDQLYVGH